MIKGVITEDTFGRFLYSNAIANNEIKGFKIRCVFWVRIANMVGKGIKISHQKIARQYMLADINLGNINIQRQIKKFHSIDQLRPFLRLPSKLGWQEVVRYI